MRPPGPGEKAKVSFWIYQFWFVRIPTTQELEMRSPVKWHEIELVGLIYPLVKFALSGITINNYFKNVCPLL